MEIDAEAIVIVIRAGTVKILVGKKVPYSQPKFEQPIVFTATVPEGDE